MSPYDVLTRLGLQLPAVPAPGGSYTSAKTVGGLIYLSGVISQDKSGVMTGVVGMNKTVEDGYTAAKACTLQHLAVLEKHLGSLERVKGVVSLNGYVNSVAGFVDSPKVVNGASDLLMEVFGEAGRHVRAAIGVSGLPRHALVETQMIVEIE